MSLGVSARSPACHERVTLPGKGLPGRASGPGVVVVPAGPTSLRVNLLSAEGTLQ